MDVAPISAMSDLLRVLFCRGRELAVGLFLAAAAMPASAQVTGTSYTLAPLAERIYFDKNAGLEDGTFFGGRLGFGFGEYTELSGIYRVSSGLSTDFSEFADLGSEMQEAFEMLPPREVNARMYGAELKFNLGRGAIFPMLSLGTGILEFDPENLDESRHIYLTGAAGLQLAFGDHFSLFAQVEDLVYRYTPTNALLSQNDVSDLGLEATDFRQVNINNLVVRVGLQMYVGGRARGELTDVDRALRSQFSSGISGISLQVEPSGGMINFSDDLGFREHQRMAGVLAGFDLGPFLGLRGFFWRGVKEDSFTDFDNIQMYGGELRLRFGEIANLLIPHLIVGGGYIDVLSGYEGNGVLDAVDRPFATGGVGLTIPLVGAIQAHGSVRSLLISADDAENITEPSQLTSNLFYSAGIRFGLGRQRPGLPATDPGRVSPTDGRVVVERSIDESQIEAELANVRQQVDSLQAALERSRRNPGVVVGASEVAPGETRAGSEFVTIPVPVEGELYVRYGESGAPSRFEGRVPGAEVVDPETGNVARRAADVSDDAPLTAEDIREIVRDAMNRQLEGQQVLRPADESETVRRLRERIEELEGRLEAEMADPPPRVIHEVAARRTTGMAAYELTSIVPFAGFGLSRNQIGVMGLRVEVYTRSLAGVRFLPELVASAGRDGVTYGLNANTAFPLGFEARSLRPYAGLGLGIMNADGLELVFNAFAGVEQSGFGGRFFAEYMSQDFFDLNRFIVGYRLSI